MARRYLAGLAIPTGVWTEVREFGGVFRERIEPGAVTSIDDGLILVTDHSDRVEDVLARGAKVTLNEREDGYHFAARLVDTATAEQAWRQVQNGTTPGVSFRFSVTDTRDSWVVGDDGVAERTIHELGTLKDISIVTWPCYPMTRAQATDHAGDGGRARRWAARDMDSVRSARARPSLDRTGGENMSKAPTGAALARLEKIDERRHAIAAEVDGLDLTTADDQETFDRLEAEDQKLAKTAIAMRERADRLSEERAIADRIVEDAARDERREEGSSWLSAATAFVCGEQMTGRQLQIWGGQHARGNALRIPWEVLQPEGAVTEYSRNRLREARMAELGVDASRALQAGTDASGGYAIGEMDPLPISDRRRYVTGVLAGSARVITTATSMDLPVPTADDTSNNAAIFAEGTAVANTSVDPTMGRVTLNAYEYHSNVVRASQKFMRDLVQQNPAEWIAMFARKRIDAKLNADFTAGNGTSKPNGFLSAGSSAVTASSATAVTASEILDLMHAVGPEYALVEEAEWHMSWKTVAEVKKVARVSATNKHGTAISYEAGSLGAPARLEGHRVIVNADMPDIATGVKSIAYGDMSQYYVRLVADQWMVQLNELFALTRETGFLWVVEADGDLIQTSAVKYITQG